MTLLEYLMQNRKESKNVLKTMVQKGSVLVDGKTITKANWEVQETNIIVVKPKPIIDRDYELPILYEDNDFLAIDKPAGLLTVATDQEKRKTAYHMVKEYCKKRHQSIYVLHRLDQETSGVLLFAKSSTVQKYMQNHWNQVVKTRGYYAIVNGTGMPPKGTIQTYLKENSTHMVYSSKTGKLAITNYEVIKENKSSTLLNIHLDTGRKNQIRVHMRELGHPILGDAKYGDVHTFPRLALHAYHLEFIHPKTKKIISVQSEIPSWIKI